MAKKETTVEEKLRALYSLQLIDSKIDEIKNIRGQLPIEIQDLEDEIERLNFRTEKYDEEIGTLETEIKGLNYTIENSKALIKKYEEQQKNVRNSREFNSITKEVEYQQLEIELAEKNIKKYEVQIEQKKEVIAVQKDEVKAQQKQLDTKKKDLKGIMSQTEKEEKKLQEMSKKTSETIEERLMKAYTKLRSNLVNKLAVVSIERGASNGSYIVIPLQIQMQVATRKKIITDEYSGRILVDPVLAEEEQAKMEKILGK